jgi:2-aminoethylphosphonate-pyruvate transaminase
LIVIEPYDPNYDFNKLHDLLFANGFTIYPGKIGRKGTFRIANMGAITVEDISSFLKALKSVLMEMGIAIPIKY